MANAKISNAAVFVPPSPPIDPATVFAAELSGANSGPTMAGIKTTVLGATYHDVKSSRALNTVYTNSGTVPIFVSAECGLTGASSAVFNVAGVQVNSVSAVGYFTVVGFVNPGETYEITTTGTVSLTAWLERY